MSDTSDRSRSPRTGQFQKGKSGNPKGRPRKPIAQPEATRSAFEIVFEKRVMVTQGGVDQELSVEEALQLRTYQDALAGNRGARREVLKMIAKREKAIVDRGQRIQRKTPPLTVKMEPTEPRNADAAMCLLGIAAPDKSRKGDNPDALILEPWAVQAALGRRKPTGHLSMCWVQLTAVLLNHEVRKWDWLAELLGSNRRPNSNVGGPQLPFLGPHRSALAPLRWSSWPCFQDGPQPTGLRYCMNGVAREFVPI